MLTFKPYQRRILSLVGCSTVLALFTALYGALAGPLLKAVFGGDVKVAFVGDAIFTTATLNGQSARSDSFCARVVCPV